MDALVVVSYRLVTTSCCWQDGDEWKLALEAVDKKNKKQLVDLSITRTIQRITSFICVRNNLCLGKKNIRLFMSRA